MKTIFSKPFVWTVFVFLLSLLVSPVNAQAPIKRGAAHKPAVTKNRTAGKHFTYRSTHRRARYYGGDYNDADSAAVDDGSLDSTATEGDGNTKFETYYMGGGYELFGRSKTYTDNADAQKSLREGLAKCDNPTTGCLTDHKALYILIAPTQPGPDARDELLRLEGLDDVVVRPRLQPDDDVNGVGASGEHDDGDAGLGADATAYLHAIHAGKHDVQQHEVRT
jgi:hypothetical protein